MHRARGYVGAHDGYLLRAQRFCLHICTKPLFICPIATQRRVEENTSNKKHIF